MTDENTAHYWERVREIYERVLGIAVPEREAALHASCGGDVNLQRDVEYLIRAFENNPDFLETPLDLPSPAPSFEPYEQRLGAYRLLRRLGSGGMGVVYLAERDDGHFQRRVAIKIASPESKVPDLQERFFRERQILADLDHPNISRLLDGGVTGEGLPYLVMEYVDGERVTDHCLQRDLAIEQRLGLFLEICLAVEHAHQRGILHRDIKPGNVLVTTDGKVKLLDFGIARILGRDDQVGPGPEPLTATPLLSFEYASPEQVRGERVGLSSDIYSLGVLLFFMIEGCLPYHLPNRAPMLLAQAITSGLLQPLEKAGGLWMTRQLTALLERALAKTPEDRYPSVAALRQDLTEILAGRPIRQARLSLQQPRQITSVILLCAALGLGGLSAIVWSVFSRSAYDSPLTRYAKRIAEAQQALRMGDHPQAQTILTQLKTDPTLAPQLGFEWGYLMNQAEEPRLFRHSIPVDQSYISPQKNFLVTTSAQYSAIDVWDLASGARVRSKQAPGQNLWSRTYAIPLHLLDFKGGLTVEDAVSGRLLARCPLPYGELRRAHFFRGAYYTVDAQGTVRKWDLSTCQSTFWMKLAPFQPSDFRSLDNGALLRVESPASLSVWSLLSRRLLVYIPPQSGRDVEGLQFDDATTLMAFFRFPDEVEVRDLRSGELRLRHLVQGTLVKILLDSRRDRLITLHHLGKVKVRFLSRPDEEKTFDLQSPISGGELLGQEGLVAVTTETGRLEILDLETMKPVAQRQAHPPGTKAALRYDPYGRRLITSGQDGTARVWSLDRLLQNAALRPFPPAEVSSVALSPDGQRLAVGDHAHLVHLWNLETRRLERTIPAHSAWVHDLSFSPDGQHLATASRDHAVKIWQVSTGVLLRSLPHNLQVPVVRYSPQGQSLVTSSSDLAVRLWDPQTGQLQREITGFRDEVRSLAWSPTQPLLATGTRDGEVRLWDLGREGKGSRLSQTPAKVTSLAFSPDGKSLVVVGNDPLVRFYDVARRRLRTTLSVPRAGGRLVAFSPDGQRLAFAGEDRAIRIFHASSGRELLLLDPYPALLTSLQFSPDGRALYTGDVDQRVQAYSAKR